MSSSLVSSLRALSLRTKPASRVLPTLCCHQPAVRFISQSALSATGAQRPAIATTVRAVAIQQQTRGMKVHSSVKKRCEHCKVRGSFRLGYDGEMSTALHAAPQSLGSRPARLL
ncbi:hypothetical protein GGR58DRAFT_147619 [Xylaria digitata]|nr:hypothetical protein GGR58DRAFT_147619 [Xylaria digitata]